MGGGDQRKGGGGEIIGDVQRSVVSKCCTDSYLSQSIHVASSFKPETSVYKCSPSSHFLAIPLSVVQCFVAMAGMKTFVVLLHNAYLPYLSPPPNFITQKILYIPFCKIVFIHFIQFFIVLYVSCCSLSLCCDWNFHLPHVNNSPYPSSLPPPPPPPFVNFSIMHAVT